MTGLPFMRRRLFRTALFIAAVGWLTPAASAVTLSGMTLPDSYSVSGQSLVLNGMGLRTLTFLRIRAYVAGLYLAHPSHDAQQILASPDTKVLILKFIRSGSKERVQGEYRAGEAKNCGNGGCNPADQADFERLVASAPAVQAGDTSTFVFTAKGVQVFANDRMIGDYANRDLARQLLAGFIGDHPPSQALRRQLLGLPED
jgi:hypothetical protein